jgi:VanZ family protein
MRGLNFREIIRSWLPVALWMAVIFLGSTDLMSADHTSRFITPLLRWLRPDISPGAIAQVHFYVRKAAHLTEYAILAILIYRAWRGSLSTFRSKALATLIFAIFFAAADEFHQSIVASRSASLGDVSIDLMGTMIGLLICGIFYLRRDRIPGCIVACSSNEKARDR